MTSSLTRYSATTKFVAAQANIQSVTEQHFQVEKAIFDDNPGAHFTLRISAH